MTIKIYKINKLGCHFVLKNNSKLKKKIFLGSFLLIFLKEIFY